MGTAAAVLPVPHIGPMTGTVWRGLNQQGCCSRTGSWKTLVNVRTACGEQKPCPSALPVPHRVTSRALGEQLPPCPVTSAVPFLVSGDVTA